MKRTAARDAFSNPPGGDPTQATVSSDAASLMSTGDDLVSIDVTARTRPEIPALTSAIRKRENCRGSSSESNRRAQ